MKTGRSKSPRVLIAENLRFVQRFVSEKLPPVLLEQLRELTKQFSFSFASRDVILLTIACT